jgi:transcription elongation factor GreB
MSKAFTHESDDAPEPPARRRAPASVPAGTRNYITPGGLAALRREQEQLASDADSAASRQRALELQQIIAGVVVTPPSPPPWDRVLFGATVTVRDQLREESTYRIVGVNEVDLDRDWISWLSPLARALLQARVGDRVRFCGPAGEKELEILLIRYEQPG